jgi:hypothetical protein
MGTHRGAVAGTNQPDAARAAQAATDSEPARSIREAVERLVSAQEVDDDAVAEWAISSNRPAAYRQGACRQPEEPRDQLACHQPEASCCRPACRQPEVPAEAEAR